VLELEGGKDEVWGARFASSARRAVRKAERAGLEIECGSGERQLEAFRDLFDRSVERWAQAQHEPRMLARLRARLRDPPRKFRAIAAAIGPSLRVWVARRDGTPVASILVLLGGDAHYTRGAMDKELIGPTAANELLHWLAIGEACEAGCRRYHMGETGSSRPLARFKEKLGARPLPYADYRFERLPLTRADAAVRGLVKRALRFRDA
jgi:lipid II:glycine glycyltransferase (peptidoglycan interpeptide bridge formation enzyme)